MPWYVFAPPVTSEDVKRRRRPDPAIFQIKAAAAFAKELKSGNEAWLEYTQDYNDHQATEDMYLETYLQVKVDLVTAWGDIVSKGSAKDASDAAWKKVESSIDELLKHSEEWDRCLRDGSLTNIYGVVSEAVADKFESYEGNYEAEQKDDLLKLASFSVAAGNAGLRNKINSALLSLKDATGGLALTNYNNWSYSVSPLQNVWAPPQDYC